MLPRTVSLQWLRFLWIVSSASVFTSKTRKRYNIISLVWNLVEKVEKSIKNTPRLDIPTEELRTWIQDQKILIYTLELSLDEVFGKLHVHKEDEVEVLERLKVILDEVYRIKLELKDFGQGAVLILQFQAQTKTQTLSHEIFKAIGEAIQK